MEDEPHLGLGVMMFVEPLVPLISGIGDEGFYGLLSLASDEVFRTVLPLSGSAAMPACLLPIDCQ